MLSRILFLNLQKIFKEVRLLMAGNETKDKLKVRKEKLAGYFFNLSQLTFTGTGVGGFLPVLKGEATVGDVSVLIFGVMATAVFAGIANKILKY